MMMRWLAMVLCVGLLAASVPVGQPAHAVEPDEVLSDPALEARARKLSAELRCLVCQNQSIDDSNAPLARDLRLIVRERLKSGDSDAAVRDFVVARYGEFVLLRPPVGPRTWLLWLAPLLLLGAVATAVLLAWRRAAAKEAPAPLTTAELDRLERLLDRAKEQPAADRRNDAAPR